MERLFLKLKLTVLAFITLVIYAIYYEVKYNRDIILENKTRKKQIYSIEFANRTHGFFILGLGSFDGYEYYSYYKIRKDGGLIKEKTDVREAIIYEDSQKPYIIEKGDILLNKHEGKIIGKTFYKDCCLKTEIHVPKGTIIKKIKL